MAAMFAKGTGRISGAPRSILLIQLGDIGDVILSLPCLRALREHFPRARVVVAVRDKAAALFEECPWVDDVIAVGTSPHGAFAGLRHQVAFLHRLRALRCDLAMDLRTGTRGAIMTWLSGAPQRIGFHARGETFWRNRLFTDLYRPEREAKVHMTDYLQNLLLACGIPVRHPVPMLSVATTRQEEARQLLVATGVAPGSAVVAVQPFSLWRYKELAQSKVAGVIRLIRQRYDLPVVVTGSAGERERVAALVKESGPGVYSLAGKTTLGQLAAVLQCCTLFIGMDSAGLHLAAAVGTPTVAVFGPSSPDSWAPRGENHRVVQKDFPCVPCHEKGCGGNGQSRCLDALTTEEIGAAVMRQLDGVAGCRLAAGGC